MVSVPGLDKSSSHWLELFLFAAVRFALLGIRAVDKPAGAEGLRHVDMGHGRCRRLAAGAPFQVLQEAPGNSDEAARIGIGNQTALLDEKR